MNPEDISEKFGDPHHCKNLALENFCEFHVKMVSPGLV